MTAVNAATVAEWTCSATNWKRGTSILIVALHSRFEVANVPAQGPVYLERLTDVPARETIVQPSMCP